MNTIFYNAQIYTLNPKQPCVQALAVKNGIITAIGSNEEVRNLPLVDYKSINMEGKTILPGLTDSHIHMHLLAKSLDMVKCETESKEACLQNIAERVKKTPPGDWILGHGWNQNNWQGGYGNLDDLDRISTQHPIFLTAKSLHAAWVNSAALQIAQIDRNSVDPVGGKFGRTSTGELSGILFESAYQIVQDNIPAENTKKLAENLLKVQEQLHKYGITSVHDFDGADCFSALQILDKERRLMMRIVKSIPYPYLDSAIQLGLRTGFGSDYLIIGSLKLFADGALGPQTAAMIAPYENSKTNCGSLMLNSDEIFEIGQKAVHGGISLAVHAIGDFANQESVKGFSNLRKYERQQKISGLWHRIEHAQLLTHQLIGNFAKYNIFASMQPVHLLSDIEAANKYWGERSKYAFPFNSLLAEGTTLVFGSDAPVESPNPFPGIFAATMRTTLTGEPDSHGWYSEQKISVEESLRAYTTAPARLAGWKTRNGNLKLNENSDFIVLDKNIFEIEPEMIKDIKVTATMVAGELVWLE